MTHRACSCDLNAEHAVRHAVGDELRHKSCRAGIIVRFVISHTGDGNYIISDIFRLLLCQTRTTCVESLRKTHNTRSKTASVGSVCSGEVFGKTAACDVGS